MSQDLLHLQKIGIDSMKIRVPLSLCKNVSDTLKDRHVLFNLDTSEIVDEKEYKYRAKTLKENGITLHIGIEKNSKTSQTTTEDCVYIKLSAKALQRHYFEGINIDNFYDVYEYIISKGLFDVDYRTLLDCAIGTDVDFKLDNVFTLDEWKIIKRQMIDCTKLSRSRDAGIRTHKTGVEFGKRETTNYISKPYLKTYHKGIELSEKSSDFKDKYFNDIDTSNIVRIETTVKNKNHFKSLGVKDNKLKTILSLSKGTLRKIITNAVSKHVHIDRAELNTKLNKEKSNDMTPTNKQLFKAMVIAMEKANLSFEMASSMLIADIKNKTQRSRAKKNLTQIYEQHIQGKKIDLKTQKIADFFRFIQWDELPKE